MGICVWVPQRPAECMGSPEAGVTGGCELPAAGGCWKLNPGPLEEQQVLLAAEPSPVLALYKIR